MQFCLTQRLKKENRSPRKLAINSELIMKSVSVSKG